MEKTGITRRIDNLGRIVIPKEIRRNLKIKDDDEIEISILEDKIVLSKFEFLKKDKAISDLVYSLGRRLNKNILFTSREKVIDYYLVNKEELINIELEENIMNLIEKRMVITSDNSNISLFNSKDNLSYIISPLIINGDLIGSLILYSKDILSNQDRELLEFSKNFLENYLE